MANFEKVLVKDDAARKKRSAGSAALAAAVHLGSVALMVAAGGLTVQAVKDPHGLDIEFVPDVPAAPNLEVKKPKVLFNLDKIREPEPPKPKEEPKPQVEERLQPQLPEPEIEIPKSLLDRRRLEIAAGQMTELRGQLDAPEPVGGSGATRTAAKPAAGLSAGDYGGGTGGRAYEAALDAPEVKVPGGGRGGPGLPARAPGMLVGDGGGGGSIVAYHSDTPATMGDFRIPAPGAAGRAGGRPGGGGRGLVPVEGSGVGGGAGSGGLGVKYGGPADAPGGEIGGFGTVGRPGGGRRGGGGIGPVSATAQALGGKYGLQLVSVNDLGQRSTEAARWNILLPQISDLLRQALARGGRNGGPRTAGIEVDGSTLVIRYRDGVVHFLVPTGDGLAVIYVARGPGARPVVSKVQEGESALDALNYLVRG